MATNVPCLLNRNGWFYFRYIITVSHKRVFGVSEFVHSLRTKDRTEAKILCWRLYEMTTQAIQELLNNPKLAAYHQIEPQRAKGIAVKYLRDSIQRMIQQCKVADMHAQLITSEGVPNNIPNRDAYLQDPTRTAKRLDFLYPDTEDFVLYDDTTLDKGIVKHRIYDHIKQENDIYPLSHMSYESMTKWLDMAIDETLNVHQQHLAHVADIQINNPVFIEAESWGAEKMPLAQQSSKLFAEAIALYMGEVDATNRVTPKSRMKKTAAFELWQDWMGNRPLQTITKADASSFKLKLLKTPSNFKKKYPKQDLKSFDLAQTPEAERLHPTTVNNTLRELATFINWCKGNGHYTGDNPFSGVFLKIPKNNNTRRMPFNDAQIQRIFSLPLYTGCQSDTQQGRYKTGPNVYWDSYYWVPILALYTGARMQEICQLSLTDIQTHKDRHFLSINDDGENKHLKTAHSKRCIPIHKVLINLGLLEYIEQMRRKGAERLFPDIQPDKTLRLSGIFTKRFTTLLRRHAQITEKNVCFHSFRHTFIDKLRNTGAPTYVIKAITGHTEGTITAHDGYGTGASLDTLFSAMDKVSFDTPLKRRTNMA